MSSTRLTNELRNRIIKAVLEHRFGPDEAALEKAKARLAQLVYDSLYSADEQKAMAALPEGWLPRQMNDGVYLAGLYVSITFAKPLLYTWKHYSESPKFPADHPTSRLFEDINTRKSKLREAKDAASAKVNGILSSASTAKKLLELWPEVEPFIPPDTAPVYLPAVPRAEVNALLGLPKREE